MDSDAAIRLAAFAHVRHLSHVRDRLTASDLTAVSIRTVHKQIFAGVDTIGYAFTGTDPNRIRFAKDVATELSGRREIPEGESGSRA